MKPWRLAGTLAALLLAGCGSSGNFTYREYGKVMGQALGSMFSRNDVPRETAAAIPYASMGYRIEGGDEAILVLATSSDESQLWTASSHVVLQTNAGRITRTVGLPNDLGGTGAAARHDPGPARRGVQGAVPAAIGWPIFPSRAPMA